MANGAIRGITVEIGGDTTKLGKALEGSEKKSRSLQTELRRIEKLLKFDPGNVELLTQKQDVLKNSIKETAQKLDTLKEAEAQVIAQFERGDIAEDQLRAFQREIMQTEKSLGDMKSELSTTETAIKNFSDGTDKAVKHTKEYKEAVEDAKEKLSDFKDTASEAFDALKTGVGVLGGAAIATGGYALNLSTEFDKAFNTLITRTGASADEMDSLNQAMENVYANNFGESIEDVAQSMATVKTNTKLSGDELQNATERAILLRDTFEFDVNESTRSAKMLMDQYGLSAEDAFNLIAQGAQNGLDKNGDLLDTINEYAVHFDGLGIGAEDMFNMLVNGAENGTFSVDKLGDAVKEFGIRAKDGSDGTAEAFEALGLNAASTSKQFAKGGEDAREALGKVSKALFEMDDPLAQNQVGVALFGTMWEDLGVEGVKALMSVEGEISQTSDALDKINEQKYDDIGSAIQGLGRTLETDVIEPLGEELKPVVEEAIEYVQANGPQIKEVLSNIVSKVGEFVGFIVNNGPTILSVIAGVGAAFVTWKVATMISGLIGVITSFIGVLKTGTTVMGALNAVMNLNPIVLIVTLIAGLVVAFITLWNTSEGFRNFWIGLWDKIKSVVSTVKDALVEFFTVTIPNAWERFKTKSSETITAVVEFFKQLPGKIWNAIQNVVSRIVTWGNNLKEKATSIAKNVVNSVVNFFKELPYKIGYAIGFVIGKLISWGASMLSWVKTNVPKIINNIVNFFKQLPGKIWTWLLNVIDKVTTWASNMRQKATSAASNFVNAAVNFIKQLPGRVWTWLVNVVSRVGSWAANMASRAREAGSNFVNSVVQFFTQLPGKIWTWLSNTVSRVVNWGSSLASKGKAAAKKLLDSVVNTAKQIPAKMKSIGKDIVDGVWNGIKNAASTFTKNVKSFFSGIVDGAKSALGINSPSKVFAEVVGKAIPEGIAKGVVDNVGLAKNSVENLTDDLSNQAVNLNGATINRQLTTTFTAGSADLAGTNSALLSKLDGIYDRLNRLQIVLDTGTLVGEAIDKIDAGLASRQLLSARGV